MRLSALPILAILIAAGFSNAAVANDSAEPLNRHIVEIAFLAGDLSHDLAEQGFDEANSKHIRFAYHFRFQSGLYFGVGYLNGESGRISPLDDVFGGSELEYNTVSFKGGYQHFSSNKHSLYAEVSIHDQNVGLKLTDVPELDFDGIGWGLSTGWRYQLSNNLGFKLGLENLVLENDISILSVSGGFSYSF